MNSKIYCTFVLKDNFNHNQARQTRPNSGGVAEGHPRFDKGGVAIIFTFYALKIELFRVITLSDLKRPTFKTFYAIKWSLFRIFS